MYALQEGVLTEHFLRKPETLAEAPAYMHQACIKVALPEALGGPFQHHFKALLSGLVAHLTLLQGAAHLRRLAGHIIQLANIRAHPRWPPLALANRGHHRRDPGNRLEQVLAEAARAHPHEREEQQVEQHQPGNQQVADLLVVTGEKVGLAEHLRLVHHRQQLPAGTFNRRPGQQVRTPAKHDRLHALRPLRHGGGQAAGLFALAQVEVFRLEDLTADRLRVGMLGQLIQAEVILTGLGQGHDVQVLADQHGVAVPGHL